MRWKEKFRSDDIHDQMIPRPAVKEQSPLMTRFSGDIIDKFKSLEKVVMIHQVSANSPTAPKGLAEEIFWSYPKANCYNNNRWKELGRIDVQQVAPGKYIVNLIA